MWKRCVVFLIVLVLGLEGSRVEAGGAVFSNEYSQVLETESRAIIIWDGKKETILDSLTFNLNPLTVWNFAWVVAVPSKPEVEPIKDHVYVKFEKLAAKKIDKSKFWQRILFFDSVEEDAQPSQIFTRPIDISNMEVIEPPNQLEKLNFAVRDVGYFIPKEGRPMLREYEKKGWYFVVAHVNALHLEMDASDSLTTTGAHTLPLRITFATDKPIYPIRLASIRPDLDSEAAVVSYDYGETSEKVLGEKDERVDELLSEQSRNKFPFLPLDFVNLKVDLFVLADRKVGVTGFTTAYANWVKSKDVDFNDIGGKKYIDLPEKNWYLTRVFDYIPMSQLDDLMIQDAGNNRRVNDHWWSTLHLPYQIVGPQTTGRHN